MRGLREESLDQKENDELSYGLNCFGDPPLAHPAEFETNKGSSFRRMMD